MTTETPLNVTLPIPDGPLVIDRRRQLQPIAQVRHLRTPDGQYLPARAWGKYGLRVLVTIDPTPHGRLLHVSISHKHRYPTWEEIKAVREAIYPADIDVMMMLPQEADYVNLHPNTFHLWQTPREWGVQ